MTPAAAPRFSLSIPAGWFMVSYSHELESGAVKPLRYFGLDLVLFRTESGQAVLVEAFCPHLGAHLGHGGRVKGDSIQCPFHSWEFDASGKCHRIPYAKRIPPGAQIYPWKLQEHSGRIWVWHGIDSRAPFFNIPEIPEEVDVAWELHTMCEWTIRSCLQELSENGADSAHFQTVHDMPRVPDLGAVFDAAFVTASTQTVLPAGNGRLVDGVIDVHSSGMGCDVIRYSGGVDLVEVVCATPVDGEAVEVRMAYRIRADASREQREVTSQLVNYLIWQFSKDIPIWENKILRPNPLLCDGDGPIAEFRRWSRQFYRDEDAGIQD